MEKNFIGPFSAQDIESIRRALSSQLDAIDDYFDHGMAPGDPVESIPIAVERARVVRILDRIDYIRLEQ